MRSMLAVLLLATAAVAQPEPLLGGLTANLLGGQGGLVGGLLGGSGGGGLLEGLLGGDGLVGGLVSGLLGPLLGGGGGGLLGGLVGGAGGLFGGGVGQVGDLVTCVLSQVLGQVGGLLDQVLGPVLGALGLQASTGGNFNPALPSPFLVQLKTDLEAGTAGVLEIAIAYLDGNITVDDVVKLVLDDVLNSADLVELIELAIDYFDDEGFPAFIIENSTIGADVMAQLLIGGQLSSAVFNALVNQGTISSEESAAIQAQLLATLVLKIQSQLLG